MKLESQNIWLFARVVVIVLNVGGIAALPAGRSNIDWPACFLVSAIASIGLFLWLMAIRFRPYVDWSETYSWRRPFLPMNKYPLRFWFLISCSLILAGAVAVLGRVTLHRGHEAVSGTFFFMGLFIMVVLRVWIKKFADKLGANGDTAADHGG